MLAHSRHTVYSTKGTSHVTILHTQLGLLRDGIASLQQQQIDVAGFCALWREQTTLLNSLPPKYEVVAEDLLGRLESGSLFREESCSFSQEDLLGNLATWLDKAETLLASRPSGS